jgi:lysophospholipid acyltransferase (LPLAT)-like uncharacterized protein
VVGEVSPDGDWCYRRGVKKILRSAPVQHGFAWFLARFISLLNRCQSWRVVGEENLRLAAGEEVLIAVFWHETLPAIPILLRQARRLGMVKPCVVLASRHRDGQLIGNIMVNLGMEQVAGSTSKGGAAGLRGLITALAAGKHVALTPDGPRGPRRVAAPGVAQLAALTGARVLPCGAATTRAVTLKSWDKMRVTLPFGRGTLVVGAPITVPPGDWQAGLAEINAALIAVQEAAAG